MKLEQLRKMALFSLVVQEGSFTKVADKQGMANSAVSSAVSQLEKELNTRLLHRSTRQLSLTDEGAIFFQHCQAMLSSAIDAHEALSDVTGQLAGELTISASSMEAHHLVLPALKPLLQANPKLILNLKISDEQVDLVSEGIDIAIRAGNLADSSLVARPLTHIHETIVASPSYIARYGSPQTVEDLQHHVLVAFSPFMHPNTLSLLDTQGVRHDMTLPIGAKTDDVEATKTLVMMGLGLARLPTLLVQPQLDNGALIAILPDHQLPVTPLYAVTLKRDLQPLKVSKSIQAMTQFSHQL